MGRTIPSVTARLDTKIQKWEKFCKMLNANDRQAFQELVSIMKDRRTAIDAADEADIGVAILLAIVTNILGRLNERTGSEDKPRQYRL